MRTEKREQKKENFIKKIIRTHRLKEEEKVRKQLSFLFQQVFQYYYSLQKPRLSEVDLPEFIYDKEFKEKAERKAYEELLYRIADRKVVNKLFTKRIKQLYRRLKWLSKKIKL